MKPTCNSHLTSQLFHFKVRKSRSAVCKTLGNVVLYLDAPCTQWLGGSVTGEGWGHSGTERVLTMIYLN